MVTKKQRFALAMVMAFGLGVLITLEGVQADAERRIRAARRVALDCLEPGAADMRTNSQPLHGDRT